MDELQRRKQAEYPPCVRIFLVEVDRKSEAAGKRILDNVEHVFARDNLTQYAIGPLIYKNKRGFRWRMILKGNEDVFYKSLMSLYDLTGVRIEADPLNV